MFGSRALLNLKLICLVKLTSHGASGICLHSSPWPSAGVHTHTAIPGFLHGVWGAAQALLSVQQTRYFKKSYIFEPEKDSHLCLSSSTSLSGKYLRTSRQPREVRHTLSSKNCPNLEEIPGSLSLVTVVLCHFPTLPPPHTFDSSSLL